MSVAGLARTASLPAGQSTRQAVAGAARTVVKVGSASLTHRGRLDVVRLGRLVDALAGRVAGDQQVILVSSGAIAAGIAPLKLRTRPRDLATQQAAAAVGQLLLVEAYAAAFARHGRTVGQVLLTADDLHRRAHYRNAQRTLERLLSLGVVPVVNENDTVATHEIRFGDNDRLAALVAHLVHADALVLLSDVDGLYDNDPRIAGSRRLDLVSTSKDLAGVVLGGRGSAVSTGGIATKLEAAGIATGSGVPVLLSDAGQVADALQGVGGTAFSATGRRPASRLFWLRHASVPRGRLVLDDGAVQAVTRRGASLLPAGVTACEGEFGAGDPVELAALDGTVVARGLVSYDSADLPALIGRSTRDLPPDYRRELVHRDDLVLF